MKLKGILGLAAAAMLLGLNVGRARAAPESQPGPSGPSLQIMVSGITGGATGAVRAAVCATPEEFVDRRPSYMVLAAAPDGSQACVKAAVIAPGMYAVKIYQDLNGNGVLDRNIFGRPQEPYAFSNGVEWRPDATLWQQASFAILGTNAARISVRLRPMERR